MKKKLGNSIFDTVNLLLVLLVDVIALYPLIYVISASISDPVLVGSGKMWLLPKGITFEGYRRIFQNSEILIGYRNTIFYTILGTAINLVCTLMCAYPLSRSDFVGRNFFTAIFTFTMFFGGGLIPTYILMKNLHFLDTIWAIVIPGAVSMWNVILTRTFFQGIPKELSEAATIDGCSNTRLFLSVILPLSAPIIAVNIIYAAMTHWNSYFNAMIYLSDRNKYTLQLILREILVQQQTSDSMLKTGTDFAAVAEQARIAEIIKYGVIVVAMLPMLIVYPFFQKYFEKGVMVGAIKG